MESYGPMGNGTNKEHGHAMLKEVVILLGIKHCLGCLILSLSLIVLFLKYIFFSRWKEKNLNFCSVPWTSLQDRKEI